MADTSENSTKYDEIAQIFKMIDDLSTSKQLEIVAQFSAPYISLILSQLVLNMTDFERKELIDKIKETDTDTDGDADDDADKRNHERKDCLLVTDYVVKDQLHKNFVKDISQGGAFIETRKKFDVGDKIVQSFSMFDEQILFKFTGEIVRIDKEGIGVKFTNLTPYQLDMLKTVMKKTK